MIETTTYIHIQTESADDTTTLSEDLTKANPPKRLQVRQEKVHFLPCQQRNIYALIDLHVCILHIRMRTCKWLYIRSSLTHTYVCRSCKSHQMARKTQTCLRRARQKPVDHRGIRREQLCVTVHRDEVLVLHDVPEALGPRVLVPADRILGAETAG